MFPPVSSHLHYPVYLSLQVFSVPCLCQRLMCVSCLFQSPKINPCTFQTTLQVLHLGPLSIFHTLNVRAQQDLWSNTKWTQHNIAVPSGGEAEAEAMAHPGAWARVHWGPSGSGGALKALRSSTCCSACTWASQRRMGVACRASAAHFSASPLPDHLPASLPVSSSVLIWLSSPSGKAPAATAAALQSSFRFWVRQTPIQYTTGPETSETVYVLDFEPVLNYLKTVCYQPASLKTVWPQTVMPLNLVVLVPSHHMLLRLLLLTGWSQRWPSPLQHPYLFFRWGWLVSS